MREQQVKVTNTGGPGSGNNKKVVIAKTKDKVADTTAYKWWLATSDSALTSELLSTAAFLKNSQQYRYRQAAIYARLYGNLSLYNFIGSNISKLDQNNGLPTDRPTFNLIQSAIDTLIAKLVQSRPQPMFLTDNGDYKERNLAKKLNNFIMGEFYQTKTYEKAEYVLRDALVEGTGCFKVYATPDDKVGLDRILLTELLIDPNESYNSDPRQLYQLKLVDRAVLMDMFPKFAKEIKLAEAAYPDNSADSAKTVADLVMVVEGWHLKSGKEAKDGRHTIACSNGIIHDDQEWDKDDFPFVFMHYSKRMLGFWSQGLAEQLMGTQLDLNSLLYTISKSIKLVGVPRIFVEEGSKVSKAKFTNDIGAVIPYRGTKPSYEVAPCSPQELYLERDKLIQYGYQQCGVSALQATSQKPAGLDSGEAIRTYDNIASDRFAALAKRHTNMFNDLAYKMIDTAIDIAEATGKKYQTIFPDKTGIKQIDLPKIDLLKDPFVIQCFDISSLPKDPAGRMQKIVEMIQAGMITVREGRRLLNYPDLEQTEKLANAAEERILQILDEIVESGDYNPPDPFMDLQLANDLVIQYYNLYAQAKLEEDRCQMLRDFQVQIQALVQEATAPPPQQPQASAPPQANAAPLPTSPLVPNANQ